MQTQASRLFEGNPQVLPPNRDGAQNAPTLCLEQLAQKKMGRVLQMGIRGGFV